MPYIIDPPSDYDLLEVWREHLAWLEDELAGNPGDEDLIRAIREAREHIALWSNDPNERIQAAAHLDKSKVDSLVRAHAQDSPQQPWPFGMATCINPFIVVLGPSPGNSPNAGDVEFAKNGPQPFDYPTLGKPHPHLFYQDRTRFFVKVRALITGVLSSVYDVPEEKALSLGGLMNLDTGMNANAANVQYRDDFVKWVAGSITQRMRPRILVCIGLSGKRSYVLNLVDPSLDGQKPAVEWTFSRYSKLRYRVWRSQRGSMAPLYIVFWPQHPSKPPFASLELWQASVEEFSSCFKHIVNTSERATTGP